MRKLIEGFGNTAVTYIGDVTVFDSGICRPVNSQYDEPPVFDDAFLESEIGIV